MALPLLSEIVTPQSGLSGRQMGDPYRRLRCDETVMAAGMDKRAEQFDILHRFPLEFGNRLCLSSGAPGKDRWFDPAVSIRIVGEVLLRR